MKRKYYRWAKNDRQMYAIMSFEGLGFYDIPTVADSTR
jgi:hypothetical protein